MSPDPKQTAKDVKNRVFDSTHKVSSGYRQYLRGGDIRRFIVKPLEKRYIRYGEWLAEPRLSAGFDAPVKILMRQTGDSLVAAVDDQRFLCMNNMHVLVPRSLRVDVNAIAAIINSRTMNWFYHSLNPEAGEALAEVKKANVDRLPLPSLSAKQMRTLSSLANRIATNLAGLAAATETKRNMMMTIIGSDYDLIEALVGDLFALTQAERERIAVDQSGHNPF